MSFAQQLEKRGFEKGFQEGLRLAAAKLAAIEIAKKLLASKVEVALIKAATELNDDELAQIAKEVGGE